MILPLRTFLNDPNVTSECDFFLLERNVQFVFERIALLAAYIQNDITAYYTRYDYGIITNNINHTVII